MALVSKSTIAGKWLSSSMAARDPLHTGWVYGTWMKLYTRSGTAAPRPPDGAPDDDDDDGGSSAAVVFDSSPRPPPSSSSSAASTSHPWSPAPEHAAIVAASLVTPPTLAAASSKEAYIWVRLASLSEAWSDWRSTTEISYSFSNASCPALPLPLALSLPAPPLAISSLFFRFSRTSCRNAHLACLVVCSVRCCQNCWSENVLTGDLAEDKKWRSHSKRSHPQEGVYTSKGPPLAPFKATMA